METLYEEPYFFTVSRNKENGEYYIEVLCGTSAVYTIRIKLTAEEITAFRHYRGSARILACEISDSPDSFLYRRI